MCLVQATFPLPLSHNTRERISSSIKEALLWAPHRCETRGGGADRYLLAIQCIPETQSASQKGPSPQGHGVLTSCPTGTSAQRSIIPGAAHSLIL